MVWNQYELQELYPIETPAIVSDLIELVKTEDRKHYNFLAQSISI